MNNKYTKSLVTTKTKINMHSSSSISLNKNNHKTVLSWDRLWATNISKSSMVIVVVVYFLAACDATTVNDISCDEEIMDLFETIKYLLLAEFIIYAILLCLLVCVSVAVFKFESSSIDEEFIMMASILVTTCGVFVSACLSFTVVRLIDQNSLQSIPDINVLFIFTAIIGSLQIVAVLIMVCTNQSMESLIIGGVCCYCVQFILIVVVFFAFIVPIWDPESIYCGDIGIECGSIGNFQNKQTDQCIKFINATAQSYDFIDCNSEQGYWQIDSADDFISGYFRIKNMQTNTCIINRDNGMFDDEQCNYDVEQFWKIHNQNGEWFQIQNKKTNYCIYQSNQGFSVKNSCVNINCLNVNDMCFRLIVTQVETCVIDYFGTTDIPYIPKLQSDSDWSTYACIAYFSFYTTFMVILALYVYYSGQHNLDTTLGQILAHFYDTATDLGVIITWYYLWQDEQNGYDYKSVDMASFFYSACAALIAYRLITMGIACWNGDHVIVGLLLSLVDVYIICSV